MDEKSILGTHICTQIGILVRDIEKTTKAYAQFFGVEEPPIMITGEFEEANSHYLGRPTRARTKQSFFDIGENITIELLEPDDEPSTWRHDLEQNGEGVHHIAFNVDGMEQCIMKCDKEMGMKLVQRGKWPTGHYAYVDGNDSLKVTLELLENGEFEI